MVSSRKETPELRKVIVRAMAKNRDDRFKDASQFLKAIDALPQPAISKKGRFAMPMAVTGLILACVFAGAVTWVATRPDPRAEVARLQAGAEGAWASALQSIGAGAPPSRAAGASAVATSEQTASDDETVEPDPDTDEANTGETSEEAARDDQPEPDAPVGVVREVRALVDAGESVPDEHVAVLRAYARENDSGPAYLLLAHVYSDRNWWSDAVRHYESAFEAEPRIADDPVVLENLLKIAAMSEAANVEAFEVVKDIYGRDALATVESLLENPETSWAEKRQLRRLRRELVRLPRRR
jgi:hypothetical protein